MSCVRTMAGSLWFWSLVVMVSVNALNVEFSYNSRGGPDLYLGDALTLTCTSTGGVAITAMALALNTPIRQWASCSEGRSLNDAWERNLQPARGLFLFAAPLPDCAALGDPSGFTYTVSGTITEDFRAHIGSAFYCFSIENRVIVTNSSTSLVIRDLKVPPKNLALTISPVPVVEELVRIRMPKGVGHTLIPTLRDTKIPPKNLALTISPVPVVEGEPFTILCTSSSNSSSVYEFEILIVGNNTWSEITGSPPTYTPTRADRGGLLVRCTDTAHTTSTGGNTVKLTEVFPNYLEAPIPSLQVLELNPTLDTSLTCDVSSRPEPVYSWTRSNGSEKLKSVRTVTLLSDETRRDGEREEVVCAATVSGTSLSSTVIWQIIWSVPHPTLTTPTPTVICQNSSQAAVVVAGVEGAVLIIIAIATLIWWWRKRKGDAKPNAGVQLEPRLPATTGDHSTPGAESNYTSLAPRHDTEEHNYQQLDVAGNSERLYCNVPLSSDGPA